MEKMKKISEEGVVNKRGDGSIERDDSTEDPPMDCGKCGGEGTSCCFV